MKENIVRKITVICPDCDDHVDVVIESVPNIYYVGCHCKRPICELKLS